MPSETPQEQKERRRLNKVRDLLVEWIDEHRATCQHGHECIEPANTLAWLAHCLGANAHNLRLFNALLLRYEIECDGDGPHAKATKGGKRS